MNDTYQNAPIESVYESKTNPRRHFDEAALAELALSVKQVGILQPLVVRSNNQTHPGMLEIVAGARRYRAAKRAGLSQIPVRICEMSDQQVLEVQLIENLLREDVNEIDEGLGFRALLDLRGADGQAVHNVQTIAERLSKSPAYVYARLKMAQGLDAPVQKAFHAGQITAGHAILLARLQPADQAEMFKRTVDHDLSVRRLEENIQHRPRLLPGQGAGFPPDPAEADRGGNRQAGAAAVAGALPGLWREAAKGRPSCEPTGKKKCESQQTGLMVDGEMQGQTVTACMNRKCRVHYASGIAYQQRVAAKAKLESQVRSRLLTEVLAKVRWPLGRVELQAIAKAYLEEMHADALRAICLHLKLEAETVKWGSRDYKTPLGKYIDQTADRDMAAFLVMLSVSSSHDCYSGDMSALKAAAARYKVDAGAIARTAAAEMAAKKKPAVQTPAKPKVKAAVSR